MPMAGCHKSRGKYIVAELFEWCRTNHENLEQEEHLPEIAEIVDIVNPNFPPSPIMSREKYAQLLTEIETWRRSNHTIR